MKKEEAIESFIQRVYESLRFHAMQQWNASAFFPIVSTREFTLVQNLMEPNCPIPSLFDRDEVKSVIKETPEHEYGVYDALNFAFIIQFCWKEPEKLHGFFKIRPKYPWHNEKEVFKKLNAVPMAITEDIDMDFTEDNKQRIVRGLLHILRTI